MALPSWDLIAPGAVKLAILMSWSLVFFIDCLTRSDLALSIAYVIPIALTLWLSFDRDAGRATVVVAAFSVGATLLGLFFTANIQAHPGVGVQVTEDPIIIGNHLLAAGSQIVVGWAVLRHRRARAVEREIVARLEKALRTTEEFVALASHELKNPLAGARGYAQLLLRRAGRGQSPALDPQSTEAVKLIDGLLGQLNALMDDMLHVSRLQSGRFDLRLQPVDIAEIVRRVAADAQRRAPLHTITVAAPEEAIWVRADSRRVEQMLINLIGNAVKYSPRGGPVDVTIVDTPGDRVALGDPSSASAVGNAGEHERAALASPLERWAVVRVRDEGMGIPPAEQGHLFERFSRASNASESSISGTGLGLYLCRMLAEAQGGRIWLDRSDVSAGSTFAFALATWPHAPDEQESEPTITSNGHARESDHLYDRLLWPVARIAATRLVGPEAER